MFFYYILGIVIIYKDANREREQVVLASSSLFAILQSVKIVV